VPDSEVMESWQREPIGAWPEEAEIPQVSSGSDPDVVG